MLAERIDGRMSSPDCMSEVASILAAGMLRSRRREIAKVRNNRSFSGCGLDVSRGKSVHVANAVLKGEKR